MKKSIFLLSVILLCISSHALIAQPANDNLCNASPLTIGDDGPCNNINSFSATSQANEPTLTCKIGNQDPIVYNSVWYSFVAPAVPVYLLAAPDHPNPPTENAFQMNVFTLNGNVSEWCQDWFDVYSAGPVENPQGPGFGIYRVVRSGGWDDSQPYCRVASRNNNSPEVRTSSLGFRLVRPF